MFSHHQEQVVSLVQTVDYIFYIYILKIIYNLIYNIYDLIYISKYINNIYLLYFNKDQIVLVENHEDDFFVTNIVLSITIIAIGCYSPIMGNREIFTI